jgi:inner membrane transporter RhtA
MYARVSIDEYNPVTPSDLHQASQGSSARSDVPTSTGLARLGRRIAALPPVSFFVVSAIFHYLGPAFAVLLFLHVSVLGVAWLRIASAAVVFVAWRKPWRLVKRLTARQRWILVALGAVLAVMNSLFYLAVDRLPLSTVGAIEFLGTVILAAIGTRTWRNLLALILAVAGVAALTNIRVVNEPLGFVYAFANCAGFMLYVVLGHKIANTQVGSGERNSSPSPMSGVDQLGAAMLVAAIVATPFGIVGAAPTFVHPTWLLWGIAVGLCSSVIPYVTDQLAMARLRRATFAFMLSILPATATAIGLIVLRQVPTQQDLVGVALVIAGVALHRERRAFEAPGSGEDLPRDSAD